MSIVRRFVPLVAALSLLAPGAVTAQSGNLVLLQWRDLASKCVGAERIDFSATMSVAVFDAVNAIEGGYAPLTTGLSAPAGSSAIAAAAQAAHDVLMVTCPLQRPLFATGLAQSLALVPDATARANGVRVGQQAAAGVLAARAGSRGGVRDSMIVPTRAGEYVPTDTMVGTNWAQLRPWVMERAEQFRVPAPPALTSDVWARDLNEIQQLGGVKSSARTADQTESAKFWAEHSVRTAVRQLVGVPGRRLVEDARFLALVDVAWSDSYVSLFEGKYHYRLWRPVTAIRNAAMDGNPGTTPDATWVPLLPTPMHPEYPCGHCLSAAAVGAVISEEFGARLPSLVLDRVGWSLRRYATAQAYVDEISESRLYAGAHPRFSLNVAKSSGTAVGRLVVEKLFKRLPPQSLGGRGGPGGKSPN